MTNNAVRTPENLNLGYEDKFKFTLRKTPGVSWFCGEATVPGISIRPEQIYNSINYINFGGTKVYFEDLTIGFRVDEDLKNYMEIWNWLVGIGSPESPEQFQQLVRENEVARHKTEYNIYSDGTLISLTNVQNLNIQITFRDLFPVSLSGIKFNREGGKNILLASAQFKYLNYVFSEG